MATYGTGDRRQNRLSRLLKKMIQGKQFMGMKRLDEINEALKKKLKKSASNVKKVKGIGKFFSEIIAPGSSQFTDPLIEYIAQKDQGSPDLSAYDLSPEEGVWGIGDMFKRQKKYTSEAIEEDEPNIWSTIGESGKGFLGKDFLGEWGKGSKGDIGGANIEGLSILDQLFSNINTNNSSSLDSRFDAYENYGGERRDEYGDMVSYGESYKQGGMVKKYGEGDAVEDEGGSDALSPAYFGMFNIYETGDTYTVKEGGTYQKWVWKTDPYTKMRFKEKKSFPYYSTYTRRDDGTLEKTQSNIKKSYTPHPREVKTKQQLKAMVSLENVTTAGTYLEGDTGLYKQDQAMADLVNRAKTGTPDDKKAALSQIAILAKAQDPALKDKSMEDIIASIKDGLQKVDIDLGDKKFQDIEDVYTGTEETLASTLTKSTSALGETTAGTYDPMMSERERRRKRETIGAELSDIYSAYGRGRGAASRAHEEATETATGEEFSVLDTLFGELS